LARVVTAAAQFERDAAVRQSFLRMKLLRKQTAIIP
jgi:hypothetical protein